MGYAGISLLSSQDINPLSPATWSAIDRTHLEASALYEGVQFVGRQRLALPCAA